MTNDYGLSLWGDSNFIVEIPNNKINGDYSTNVAMELAKKLHKNPREIAIDIVTNIKTDNIIEKIDIYFPLFSVLLFDKHFPVLLLILIFPIFLFS